MTDMIEVPAAVVIRRVRRRLGKSGLALKPARSLAAQREKAERTRDDWECCFRWNVIDAASGRVLLADLDLEAFARALGVLHYATTARGLPTPGPGF